MYKHINSASRLHTLLQQALQISAEQPAYKTWAEVFEIGGENNVKLAHLVNARLNWLHEELELLEMQVQATGLSKALYEPAFNRVEQIISPLNLNVAWPKIRGNLTADTLLAFHYCNEILPDEESVIDTDVLKEILEESTKLRQQLEQSEIPDHLKQFINHQIDLIEKALAQYRIFGAKALRENANTALGEIIQEKERLVPQKNSDVVTQLRKLWSRVNSVADAAIKVDRIVHVGQRAWDNFLSWLQ